MNKAQKQVTQAQLNREKQTIKELKQVYQKALRDCEQKIRELSERTDMENLQSIIYQKQYQEALEVQLEGVLSNLQSNSYATVSDYLTKCYRDGYTGVMYDLQQTGIPIIMPIDQAAVVRAIQTDSKLSKSLYDKMGEDVTYLKKAVRAEVSRGIANGSTWNEVAGKLSRHMANTPFKKAYNNSIRIARTEGHRIQVQSALDAQHVAKSKGADIVKQWDATLDGATREHHQMLDGQIREVDEPFEVENLKVEAPGMFGLASEDCNCRCCLLQRARWALDDEELQTLKDRAAYFDLDKTKDFEEYQEKYLGITQEDIQKYDSTLKADFKPAMTIEEAEEYAQKFFENGYSPTFKGQAVYKGISLEHANEINKTLEDIYSQYEIPKLKGIKAISPTSAQGKKIFSSDDAVAAYNPAEHGIFINKKVLKDAKALEAYNKEAEDAWDIVMKNIDKLTGRQLELAETYKRAGRQIVGNGSVKDYITHEMGHHAQWTIIDPKTGNAIGDRMSKYAPHISGYANASRGEYIAESYAAYMKGQKGILDPEFVKLLDRKQKEDGRIVYRKKPISDDIFETSNLTKSDSIRPKTIRNKLNKSELGKEILTYLQDNKLTVNMCYGIDNPHNLYGYYDSYDDEIIIFCDQTITADKTAEIIVHEAMHRKLGGKGTFEEEVKCFEAEILHRKGKLTAQDKEDIIKKVRERYPELS